ncbi:hypothetical protein C8R46DRAFT_1287355 [Mycena filopes]|nr:hypothetical protein C8R46DRAFT_1287355 [Mycena filopes]
MAQPSQSTVNNLPDEVLATILKLATDFPPFALVRTLPFPVVAGRVSRRWRSVVLGSPELWTTIRIFDNSRSCHWAAVFAKRSHPSPLDITINVQSYGHSNPWDPGYRALQNALAIVGPHIARWRTFALRGSPNQLEDFRQFMLQSPLAPFCLESLHLDEVRGYYEEQLLPLDVYFAGGHLRALRVNSSLEPHTLASFDALHSLDIQCGRLNPVFDSPEFQHLLASSLVLTTLVLREFHAPARSAEDAPIISASVRSLSIHFHHFWWYSDVSNSTLCSLTSRFSFLNLESLEIVGGFSGVDEEESFLRVPESWEAPLFGPHLCTLRLEKLGFSRKGLALIQSFSPDITHLELIHIERNAHLLARSDACDPWPALRALTVEVTGNFAPKWVPAFLAVRAAIPQRRIKELTLSPWEWGITLDGGPWPTLHWQRGGPSAGLTEAAFGVGKFYLDDGSMRVADFEDLWDVRWDDHSLYDGSECDDNAELTEEAIEGRLRMMGRLMRSKGRSRESRRYKPTRKLLAKSGKLKVGAQRRRTDLREDFYIK